MKNKNIFLSLFFSCICLLTNAQDKLHVIIVGLSHDHVNRILDKNKAGEIIIEGIVEKDQQLCNKKKEGWQLPGEIFYKDLSLAIKKLHPDLVMVYNAPSEHLAVVKAALPLHVPVMMEKPLCFNYTEAVAIENLSKQYNTKVFTNFPSQWYTSFNELLKESSTAGDITKMIMRGGHAGPIEIGCSKDFTAWLTDSAKNGGGALIDFGCYGALAMTQLMQSAPVSVFANTRRLKPTVYTKVDDEATIVLEYKNATGVIEASWGWPYTIMDVEVYGKQGYLHAAEFDVAKNGPAVEIKANGEAKDQTISTPQYKDEIAYLTDVIKNGAPDNNKMMSLPHNLIVVKILDAAKKSAREGRRINL